MSTAEMVLYEVYLTPGSTGEGLLSKETVADTAAQVMTLEEAKQVGFHGLPDDPRPRVFLVCSRSHARRIQNVLEASDQVGLFQVHEIDM